MSDAPLMLSVSGLRGLIGESLTPQVAVQYASAFSVWLKRETGAKHPHVVLGRDSRPSGQMVQSAVVAALIANGCKVTVLGIVSTPGVGLRVVQAGADAGMVITASHNPIIWNGIKIIRGDGIAPSKDQADEIIKLFHEGVSSDVDVAELQPIDADQKTHVMHSDACIAHVDKAKIMNAGLHVVLNSVHGAGGPGTAQLLTKLNVPFEHYYAETTGEFPGSPEPTADNLKDFCAKVVEHKASVGFAQDPDADRLAIIDEKGNYIGEEYTLALCAKHVLSQNPGPCVANLSTSRMLDDVAAEAGQMVFRSKVGEANVAELMREQDAVVGGEGNGGIIWPEVGYIRDSFAGIAIILDLLAATGKTVSELVAEIPAYCIVKEKLPIAEGMAEAATEAIQEHFASEKIDLQDGIRVDIGNKWVHVRSSNTEPILRIIAEAPDEATAKALVEEVSGLIG